MRRSANKKAPASDRTERPDPSAPSASVPAPLPSERARQVRGEPLIEKILEATLDELARVGYAALSVETVAERAGVNKTTVYRRWPTKTDLVGAAVKREADTALCSADTGSLRSDMIAILAEIRDMLSTRRGQALIRMILAEGLTPEVAALMNEIRKSKESGPKATVARAVARGELPRGTDVEMVFSMLVGSLQHLLFFHHETPTNHRIAQIVDLVLEGARRGSGRGLRTAN